MNPNCIPNEDLTAFLDSCTPQEMRSALAYLSGHSASMFTVLVEYTETFRAQCLAMHGQPVAP